MWWGVGVCASNRGLGRVGLRFIFRFALSTKSKVSFRDVAGVGGKICYEHDW